MTNNTTFIERKFKSTKESFNTFIKEFRISIILGEVGSGKTCLLKNYYEAHKESSKFVELITLSDDDIIDTSIDVVLLDSIDEALYITPSHKIIKKRLSDYILKCREINSNVKFVISCRYSEWDDAYIDMFRSIDNEYVILQKEIESDNEYSLFDNIILTTEDDKIEDRSIKKYEFDKISDKDINNYLVSNKINTDEFWSFIDKYALNITNIKIILELVNNFEEYENLPYCEVYNAPFFSDQ